MPDLLLELFSEEIPARMQARAADDLKRLVTDGLVERGLTYADAAAFATPRRLTLSLAGLPAVTPDTVEERKGPRVDAPEKALEGFLRSTGLIKDQLEARDDKKGQVWFATIRRKGRSADEVIAETVAEVIRGFPWPKSMRWGAGSLRWVRPLHSILCLLSDETGARIVPVEVDGISAGDTTEGHRFMGRGRFAITGFEDYVAKLRSAHVVLDAAERAETIWQQATEQAFAQGLELVEDKGLLAEVAGLVEWPVVLIGRIEERFLDLPPEVLQTSMKEHQKFFSVRNPTTGRIEGFVTVANIAAPDGGKTILEGNARVLAARLADAAFFWENDLRKTPSEMAEALKTVTFHNKLGTQWERIERIAALARQIAPHVSADPDIAERAARLAKADLASEMVYEFPELQGTMGGYYLTRAGEPLEIAAAAAGHYKPLGPTDDVPSAPVTIAVALADKIDLLTGMWAIDEKPTGSKDPFALRRAALGIIRTILEYGHRLHLRQIIEESYFIKADGWLEHRTNLGIWRNEVDISRGKIWITGKIDIEGRDVRVSRPDLVLVSKGHSVTVHGREGDRPAYIDLAESEVLLLGVDVVSEGVLSFLADRLKVHLRDEGIRHDVIQACFELREYGAEQDDLVRLVNRVRALQTFLDTEDGANLLAGYKRANNILRQAREGDATLDLDRPVDRALLEQPEEKTLHDALAKAEGEIETALGAEDFARAMQVMAGLRAPIDAFFEGVLVNADDPAVRLNRLRLLARIVAVMRAVAVWEAIEG